MIVKALQTHGDSYYKDVQSDCWEVAIDGYERGTGWKKFSGASSGCLTDHLVGCLLYQQEDPLKLLFPSTCWRWYLRPLGKGETPWGWMTTLIPRPSSLKEIVIVQHRALVFVVLWQWKTNFDSFETCAVIIQLFVCVCKYLYWRKIIICVGHTCHSDGRKDFSRGHSAASKLLAKRPITLMARVFFWRDRSALPFHLTMNCWDFGLCAS